MTNRPLLSSDFSSLVSQLQQCPDDQILKQLVVSRLPEIKAIAEVNPLAMFHLAQIHSPTSPQYKLKMRQSANLGCTNAMLALCELMVSSSSGADMKTAAHYLNLIARSNDSFIIQKAQQLLEDNPDFALEVNMHDSNPNQGPRFFSSLAVTQVQEELELDSGMELN